MLEILAGGGPIPERPPSRPARRRTDPTRTRHRPDAQDLAARPAALSGGRRTHILAASKTIHLSKSLLLIYDSHQSFVQLILVAFEAFYIRFRDCQASFLYNFHHSIVRLMFVVSGHSILG